MPAGRSVTGRLSDGPGILDDQGRPILRDIIQVVFARSEPHSFGLLRVDDVHEIYWEEAGRPDGIPAVYLHGGPAGPSAGAPTG